MTSVSLEADPWDVIPALRRLHHAMLRGLLAQLSRPADELAAVSDVRGGDVIYHIDEHGEEVLLAFCEEWSKQHRFLLVAEGVGESGRRMFPASAAPGEAEFVLLVDPIDGTRGLMYGKRSAWILSGVAPVSEGEPTLRDIRWAVMTEVPTPRARFADQLWAAAGQGAAGMTYELPASLPGPLREVRSVRPRPSLATDLRHGFASLVKFFPGGKVLTASLEEALFEALMGPPLDGTPQLFDDQYISTGGQLYEMMMGRDRFLADLRPYILPRACSGEAAPRLCAHPYDLATELIAREAGLVVSSPLGSPLDAPLDVDTGVAWVAYANPALRDLIQPVLLRLMRRHGLLP